MSRLFAFLAFAALAPAAWASPQTPPGDGKDAGLPVASAAAAPIKSGLLSAAQIQARLVGNTIDGVDDGKPFSEYVVSDGSLRGVGADGLFTGTWRIANNQFCYRINPDSDPDETAPNNADASWEWECSQVTLVGDKLFWSDDIDEGDVPDGTVRAGDPDHL